MNLKQTLALRAFGLFKIPVLFYCRPSVMHIDDNEAVVKIPLRRRTKNHLGSMYFGVLAVGADCAAGLLAMHRIRQSGKKISLVFKDFKAEFLKRPDADVHFVCREGSAVQKLVEETIRSGERVHQTLEIIATTPQLSGDEPVARFELTLSLKAQS